MGESDIDAESRFVNKKGQSREGDTRGATGQEEPGITTIVISAIISYFGAFLFDYAMTPCLFVASRGQRSMQIFRDGCEKWGEVLMLRRFVVAA